MKILIVGVGSIGERHLRAFLRQPDVRCSIVEPNDRIRRRIATTYEVETVLTDLAEADLDDFDGVVLCVPAHLHVPMATQVLNAGCHALIEKPLSVDLNGIDDLIAARDRAKRVASMAFTMRSDPVYQEMRQRLADGDIGKLLMAHYYSAQNWPKMRQDYPPAYALRRETGGGAIPDHLVHTINMLQWLAGPAIAVAAAHTKRGLPEVPTEDTAFVALRYAGGVMAQLGLCLCQQDTTSRMQLVGETGTIVFGLEAPNLRIYKSETEWQNGAKVVSRDEVFAEQARHFLACMAGSETPRCSIEEAELTLRTVLAALVSGDGNGAFVSID